MNEFISFGVLLLTAVFVITIMIAEDYIDKRKNK